MSDLLPCAHCGGKATLLHGHFLADNTPYVICDDCEIQTAYCDTEAEAEAVWNQRSYTTVELDETQGFTDTVASLSDAISLVDWTPSELLAAIGRGEIKLSFTLTGLEPNAEGELHD